MKSLEAWCYLIVICHESLKYSLFTRTKVFLLIRLTAIGFSVLFQQSRKFQIIRTINFHGIFAFYFNNITARKLNSQPLQLSNKKKLLTHRSGKVLDSASLV